KIKCIDETEQNNLSKEIEKRLSGIDIHKFMKDVHNIRYYGYGAFEIVCDETYKIKKIVNIPQEYIHFEKEKGWFVNLGEEIPLDNPYKFIVCTYNDNLKNIMGKSDLVPLQETYEAKKGITSKMRSISERYGDIIVVFAYDPNETEEDIKARGQELKNIKGKSAIGIPVWDGSLKDSVHFISLSDLSIEIHTKLEDRWKSEISKYILAADYSSSQGGVGSFSRDQVQQKEQEKQEEDLLKFIRECFQRCLEVDAMFYGYDSNNYVLTFEKEIEKKDLSDIRQKDVTTEKIIFETMKSLGYGVTKEYIADKYGIPSDKIVEVNSQPVEFARGFKKRNYN
ncbi:MAG: hypothetical protein MJH09_06420, partial [Cetobacterium sp.]|nr:hypothetical protein [Cetobacterium sp.]